MILFTNKLLTYTQLKNLGYLSFEFGIFLVKLNKPPSLENVGKFKLPRKTNLGCLDSTKFGIFLGITLFIKKLPTFIPTFGPWDLSFEFDIFLVKNNPSSWENFGKIKFPR